MQPPPSGMPFAAQPAGHQAGPPPPTLPQASWGSQGYGPGAHQSAPQLPVPPSQQHFSPHPSNHYFHPAPASFQSPGLVQYPYGGPGAYRPPPQPYSAPPIGAGNYSPAPQPHLGSGSGWSPHQTTWSPHRNVRSQNAPLRAELQPASRPHPLAGMQLAVPGHTTSSSPAPHVTNVLDAGRTPNATHAGHMWHPSGISTHLATVVPAGYGSHTLAEPKSPDDSASVPPLVAHKPYTKVERAFQMADTHRKNQLDLHAFDTVLTRLGLAHILHGRIVDKFQRADKDGNGTLSFEEVVALVPEVLADAAFARVATDAGTRELAPGEMNKALALVGIELDKGETYRVAQRFDRDGSYTISNDEFLWVFAEALNRHRIGIDQMLTLLQTNLRKPRTPSTPGDPLVSRAAAEAAFRSAMPNAKGELGLCGFGKALDELGVPSGAGMFKKFADADKDGNKAISLNEFVSFFDVAVR